MSGPTVTRKAHAKINVFLRVMGRRADGFHDIESVVLPISLHDVVSVVARSADGTDDQVAMDLRGVAVDEPISGDDNLVRVAADRLAERSFPEPGRRPACRIAIDKHIPIAAGLGGGSADAAATLRALNELWGLSLTHADLSDVAATIGSDVPAMLAGEAVFMAGRGERLTPVHTTTTWWVVKPFGFPVAAADAYAWWDAAPTSGPDPGALVAALETGDVGLLGDALFNDLQPAVVARHPVIGETIEAFMDAGALGAIMSGSGPTVAALARHMGHADRLADAVAGAIVVSGPPELRAAGSG
jgi:4-diphosphocytidyl-2-C-methyl-D-erythritol kinase